MKKKRKKQEAKARKEAREKRSNEEQLARLDAGNYQAVKERKRLA